MLHKSLKLYTVSSLKKFFPDESDIEYFDYYNSSMLLNERFSFQIIYQLEGGFEKNVKVKSLGSLTSDMEIRQVGLVPAELITYPGGEEGLVRTTPGLYPDPLYEIPEDFCLLPGQWRSLYITIPAECNAPAGTYTITIGFFKEDNTLLGTCDFTLERIPLSLPEQNLLHTEWFHTDCISSWYDTPVFSEKYWVLVEKYLKTAVKYGINTILTPLFTPPLDTAIGKERPTVQLIEVTLKNGTYYFDFKKLKRWINLCQKVGITHFEFSHLFTQWGAKHTPKIVVIKDSTEVKLFGWHTDASSPEYKEFLESFLPELLEFLKIKGLEKHCFFHVSDEPNGDNLKSYEYAKNLVQNAIKNYPIIDAISSYDFYKRSQMDIPVCSTDHIQPFIDNQAPNLWAYYCSGQFKEVSNRFFAMPSVRNRIIGLQLYKYSITGFLHWGFNFWYSELSRYPVNPFIVTDAANRFPSGDSFLVYPGPNAPIPSLRLEVFYQGLQDLRCLQLLETYIGREEVIHLLEEDCTNPITFKDYPIDDNWLLEKRKQINDKLKSFLIS
jgi:hypothetical protein